MLLGETSATTVKRRRAGNDDLSTSSSSTTTKIVQRIKKLDTFAKTEEDFVERTNSGGLLSLFTFLIIGILMTYEINYYLSGETVDVLSVDLTRHEQLRINLDVTFHALPCSDVNIDVMDVMGDPMLRMQSHVYKIMLDQNGKELDSSFESVSLQERERSLLHSKPAEPECGDCHVPIDEPSSNSNNNNDNNNENNNDSNSSGGQKKCCNTCEDVKAAMRGRGWENAEEMAEKTLQCKRDKEIHSRIHNTGQEGCRVHGFIGVNKIAGNFHFAPGNTLISRHGHHIHEFKPEQAARFNVTHTINALWFGDVRVPTVKNILDETTRISAEGPGVFQYFIKVVPTTFMQAGEEVYSYQYAVTEHKKGSGSGNFILPGVFFMYDISPIRVTITHTRESLGDVLTRLLGVAGGILTLCGTTDAVVHSLVNRRHKRGGGGML